MILINRSLLDSLSPSHLLNAPCRSICSSNKKTSSMKVALKHSNRPGCKTPGCIGAGSTTPKNGTSLNGLGSD